MDLVLEKKGIYTEHKSIFGLPNLYYEPVVTEFLGMKITEEPSVDEMIRAYYIENDSETFGYYTGIKSVNRRNGTTQVPVKVDIISNKVNTITIHIGSGTTYIMHPTEKKINSDNAIYLELLDALEKHMDVIEVSPKEFIKHNADRGKLKFNKFIEIINEYKYSDMTKKVIINAFAQ